MTEQHSISNDTVTESKSLPELCEAEALTSDLRRILVRSEQAFIKGDARENMEQLERWIESYRRGMSAAQKISNNGSEMLHTVRNQLLLSLEELQRLEDEGGNPPDKAHANDCEELASAIRRIDRLLPVVEQSFQKHEPAVHAESA